MIWQTDREFDNDLESTRTKVENVLLKVQVDGRTVCGGQTLREMRRVIIATKQSSVVAADRVALLMFFLFHE